MANGCEHDFHLSTNVGRTMSIVVSEIRSFDFRDGAGVGGSVSSVNVTFFSIHDFRPRPLARPGQPQLADWNSTPSAEPLVY